MKNLLIHGLGQGSNAWNTVKNELNMKGISSSAPDLFELAKGKELDYNTVYQVFSRLCDSYEDRLNLCGLSLGGLLALNYAIQYPEKINSLVLIGTPYEIPKGFNLNFMELVAMLGCPALILCGAKDKTNMESAKRFHEAMKNSKLVIVDDSGHEVNKDNPNELVSILQDFWAER